MIFLPTYVEQGWEPPQCPRISDAAYEEVLPRWPKFCVDAVLYFVEGSQKYMVIPMRKIEPKIKWVFGGRLLIDDTDFRAAMIRKLEHEIKIDASLMKVSESPFATMPCKWAGKGAHFSISFVFLVEITRAVYDKMCYEVKNSPEYAYYSLDRPADIASCEDLHPQLRRLAKALNELTPPFVTIY